MINNYTEENVFFVNDIGVKWWKNEYVNTYAHSKNLPDINAWLIEDVDGVKQYVLTDTKSIIYTTQLLESLLAYVDMLGINDLYK